MQPWLWHLNYHFVSSSLLSWKVFILYLQGLRRHAQNSEACLVDRVTSSVAVQISHFCYHTCVTSTHSLDYGDQVSFFFIVRRLIFFECLISKIRIGSFVIMCMCSNIKRDASINHSIEICIHPSQSFLTKLCLSTTNKWIMRERNHKTLTCFSNAQLIFQSLKWVDILCLEVDEVERIKQNEVKITKC